ncbi:hypothetical protein SAMN04489712_12928 [Thermomonospora echinospora]|uniref:Ketoreductase domain-containing protein n=1 Tax=Thermomonospora echinospora TaxID=1992 RepID=A0A1H6E2Q3_9ACTN|nr:SDR family oxidoreductase [Thermomonospora echinospora]SEG91473.1 hypothetical protein SAMN04489712_12928 [Thermomonospora echinospora]
MNQTPFDLQGRVAVVTGGNAGIGAAVAGALAAAGCDVAIWGRDQERNRDCARRLAEHGRAVLPVACDVSDELQVERAMSRTVEELGRPDVCVANAGTAARRHPSQEYPLDEWHRVMGINLDGCFLTLRAAARRMVEGGAGGSLVAISSAAALQGMPGSPPYAAAKAAVLSLVRSLAVEFARHGIRANAVLPGWIDTDMIGDVVHGQDSRAQATREAVLRRIPARRWGRPEDIGGAVVYLASDAAAYHTGDTLVVDGGYTVF